MQKADISDALDRMNSVWILGTVLNGKRNIQVRMGGLNSYAMRV